MEPIMKMYMVSLLNQLCIIGNSKRKQMFQKKKKKPRDGMRETRGT